MKTLTLFLFLAASCRSTKVDAPSPDGARSEVTVRIDRSTTAEHFLKQCQHASGLNLTYTESVATSLRALPSPVNSGTVIQGANAEDFLRDHLDAIGFELVPIGPTHLRVFEVRARSS